MVKPSNRNKREETVVGGEPTKKKEFPSMVSVFNEFKWIFNNLKALI